MKRIAIFASGEGTNTEHIIRYFNARKTAEIALVVASRPTAGVIGRAADACAMSGYIIQRICGWKGYLYPSGL